eukprot:scaffold5629_cov48-Cyclotella_meneghiniana.AAC.7
MAFVRSQTISERQPHSDGHAFPPKVSLVNINANSSSGNNVQHLNAVFHARCILRNADLKSIIEQRIRQLGYLSLMATTLLIKRRRAWPKMQGSKSSSFVLLLTDVPDPHL